MTGGPMPSADTVDLAQRERAFRQQHSELQREWLAARLEVPRDEIDRKSVV